MSVRALIGRLGPRETRAEVAHALAIEVGAEDLLFFLRDPELGVLLPAPGFPQTIRGGAAWRSFLAGCLSSGSSTGQMPCPRREADVAAWGYRVDADSVLVLLGGAPTQDVVAGVLPLFSLVGAVAAREGEMRALEAKAQMATTAAAQSDVLARALERSRDQIREALASAREARRLIEEQAEELAVTAEELEQAKGELQMTNEELVAANERLQQSSAVAERARDTAEEANRAKSGFLAMMSHELRTPLNAIGGYTALLDEGIMGPLAPGQREYLSRIKRSQMHLSALINDVLNFAKTESGTIPFAVERLELRKVLASVAPLISPMAESRQVVYEYDESDADVVVQADRDKVVQVVLNLLTNAVKFTPANGTVVLRIGVASDRALITVSDSGPGIPEDQRSSIFEPFVQLERSFASEREGVGLGLSISRALARGMGGDLNVESEVGRGSTFIFSLPRVRDTPARDSATSARVAGALPH